MSTASNPSTALKDWTTLRVGGVAQSWVTVETDDDARAALTGNSPTLILGGGSNLVVADAGFAGTVVHMASRGMAVRDLGDVVEVQIAAGEDWDAFVALTVDEGWSGVEAMSGIPGLVGATPVQNVGAYGQDISGVVHSVRVLDRTTGDIAEWSAPMCEFGFRTSRIKAEAGRWAVLSVTLHLRKERQASVRYQELATLLATSVEGRVDVDRIREGVLHLLRSKGMVLDADDHDTWSVGSYFVNPIVTADQARTISPDCPRYPANTGVKLPAGWLIESAGIQRGFSLPDSHAAVSGKHSLALTNRGEATCAQVLELAEHIRARVEDVHGISLRPEPVIVD